MTREQILSYVDKGDVVHNGYTINVTKKDLRYLKNYIIVELKAINEFTDSPIHTGFLDYLPEDSLIKIEESFEKEIEIMKKQAEINNKEPLKLVQIENISNNYEASFKDENNKKYVLMRDGNRCTLTYFDNEPYYSIKTPVKIDGKVIGSKYSFWMDSGFYNADDFADILSKNEMINDDNEEGLIL